VNRRAVITMLGGAAAWPLAAGAQQPERMRRIGVVMSFAPGDPESQLRIAAFERGLRDLGWVEGRNLRTEYRWADNANALQAHATELASMAPDLILANSTPVMAALKAQTRTLPIVFVQVTDPIGQGFVSNLARPGGNITGFTNFEFTVGTKWLEALKEIAPHVTRVAVVFNPNTAPFAKLFQAPVEAAAPSFSVTPIHVGPRSTEDLESMIGGLAREPNGGLMVLPDVSTVNHRGLIVALAARHRLPAVYPFRLFATSGGLLSYGPDVSDVFRRVASYVDRILKGADPGQLPVQAPVKYELVINLKTAKALGLEVPGAAPCTRTRFCKGPNLLRKVCAICRL
jgi:ABC-type uncharacterized transport system substrate-binding protein